MLKRLKQIIALWDALEKPPVGWKYSVLKLAYYAAIFSCNGNMSEEKKVMGTITEKEENDFIKLMKSALKQLPPELRARIDAILRPNVFRF